MLHQISQNLGLRKNIFFNCLNFQATISFFELKVVLKHTKQY